MSSPVAPAFRHIRDWIFDLDNCLYPASTGLFELIDERMGAYIQRLLDCDPIEARRVQKAHFHAHGTTLAGLMAEHHIDPHHFLDDVHAIALDVCGTTAVPLAGPVAGPKFVSHGDAPTPAEYRSDRRRRPVRRFARIHSSELSQAHPHGYALLCERFGIDPAQAVLVEDMAANLQPAKALGMTTVWVDNGSERGNHGADMAFIDHRIADVTDWLEAILEDEQ